VPDPETTTVVEEPGGGRQPELRRELYGFVDRAHLEIVRILLQVDGPGDAHLDRACVVAALLPRLHELVDREARLALANGRRGSQATLARALGVSPQAVSKRYA
jgi:hypothetical protein